MQLRNKKNGEKISQKSLIQVILLGQPKNTIPFYLPDF